MLKRSKYGQGRRRDKASDRDWASAVSPRFRLIPVAVRRSFIVLVLIVCWNVTAAFGVAFAAYQAGSAIYDALVPVKYAREGHPYKSPFSQPILRDQLDLDRDRERRLGG